MSLHIERASPRDVWGVALNLRQADVDECRAASGQEDVALSVVEGARASGDACWAARVSPADDLPFALFGVARGEYVWMLCTPEVSKVSLRVLKESKVILDDLLGAYPYLHNISDTRNKLHQRWISLLGFQWGDTVDLNGVPFRHFYKHRKGDAHV